jgi:hypothetical protein
MGVRPISDDQFKDYQPPNGKDTAVNSRSNTGGYEPRFIIERADGEPIASGRRYMVLSFDGSDPEGVEAIRHYAKLKASSNPELTADILANLDNPAGAPAQHRYA